MLRVIVVVGGAAIALAGCSAIEDVQGLVSKGNKNSEYRAVRNQPLVVPPGFDLRPPRGGGSATRRARSTTVRARRTVLGSTGRTTTAAGTGERALVRKAARGVSGTGNLVRGEVDKESKDNKKRERKFTDKLLKWENRGGASVRKNPLGGKTDPVIKRKGQIF